MNLKTMVVCAARTGSQLLINALKDSDISVAPRSAELFCGHPGAMPYPEFLTVDFKRVPTDYWDKHSNMGHIAAGHSRCELFKLLYHHLSPEVEGGIKTFHFFHLKRRNLLAQYVSGKAASVVGWECNRRFNGSMQLDLDQFIHFRDYCLSKWSLYDSYPKSVPLWFEDGLDVNLSIVCDKTGIKRPNHTPKTIKVVSPDLSQVIENYKDFKEHDFDYSRL
jgi:hypothetical protein